MQKKPIVLEQWLVVGIIIYINKKVEVLLVLDFLFLLI